VVAFSSTLNAVLVPQAFIDWSNKEFAPEDHTRPSRLLMQVSNPADEKITTYFQQNGLEMESDRLNAEKTTYFLRLIVTIVMVIGLIISALSFYILMLSIYLLVQKNTEKLQNLLLIGYRRTRIALPYQLLTMALNVIVLLVATLAIIPIRNYYMTTIDALYPEIAHSGMLNTIILGIILLCVVTTLNAIIIRRKINHI
jgi:cell division protein FtsX